ncbi:MAG: FecR family protein [Alphaproteobacteria bacterium]
MSRTSLSHVGRTLACGLSLGALLAAAGAHAATEADLSRVGITGAVNPATTGTAPNADARLLTVGSDVVFREKITTTAEGQAQILFLDQSALLIGPSSEVTLDEFVYDPNSGKGNMVASLSQGAFRFVGGKLSKQGNATLRTPVATIGIRGSDVTVVFDAARNVANVLATHGFASIQTEAGKINLITGFMSTIGAGGASSPTRMTPQALAQANSAFEGKSGKSGGTTQPPTDQQVANSGLSSSVQGAELSSIEPAAGNNGDSTGGTPGSATDEGNQASTTGTQSTPPRPQVTAAVNISGVTGRYKLTTGDSTGNFGTRRDGGAPPTFNQPEFNADNYGSFSGGTLTRLSNGSVVAIVTSDHDHSQAVLAAVPTGNSYTAVAASKDDTYITNEGALEGQTADRVYVAPDHRFVAASLSQVTDVFTGFTGDRLFIFGGTTVEGAELLAKTGTLRRFNLLPDPMLDSNIPFIRRDAGGALDGAIVSPLYMISPQGELATTGRVLQGSIVFDGEGASQKSAVVLAVGSVFREPTLDGNVTVGAQLRGTARLSATPAEGAPYGAGPDIMRMSGATWSAPDGTGRSFYGQTTADYMVLDENSQPSVFNGGGGLTNNSAFEGHFYSTAGDTRYGFNHVAVRDPGPAPVGERSNRVLNGYVGGFGETRTSSGGFHFSGPYVITNADPNDVFIRTMATDNNSRVQADLSFQGGEDHVLLLFGHTESTTIGQRSAFIDDDRFGAVQRAAVAGSAGVTINGVAEEGNAAVNGIPSASVTYLMSSGVVDGYQAAFPGTTFCTCEYTKWGFWGGEVRVPGEDNRRDRIHLANWVAGILPNIENAPAGGTATFGGHVIGTAQNGGAMYVAAGNFTNAYNFGTKSGTFNMTFDGKSVSGTVNGTGSDWRNYTGGVGGSGVAGTINGSFYGKTTAVAPIPQETGGNFTLGGEGYKASGIFAGKR